VSSLRPLDWRGTATALLLSALWGANPVAVKIGLADAPPLRLAFFRFVLGGLVILAYAWWTRHPGVFDVRPGEWRVLISLGVIFSIQIGTMNVGLSLTTAAHGAVLLNSYAVHTVVLAHFMIPGDRMTSAKVGGVLIAYTGIVLLAICSLTTPLFGVLVAAAVTGDQLSLALLLSSLMVAAGIGLTVRR
jgi:drug/metabolite transporter (DMT)-like permease